ncbi:Spc97 / Spc98 family protein [Cryptosporidium felis]|nr:Spc97 / Spc98 family protein [Cryptosporidium felis]
MIHDILLSLTGSVGEKFELEPVEFSSNSISLYSYKFTLKLKSSLQECLSETEKRLVERILEISSHFYSVNEFVRSVQSSVYVRQKSFSLQSQVNNTNDRSVVRVGLKKRLLRINPVGLYIQAVSGCMQEYILRFLQKVSQLELEVFENPSLPLTFILASISKPGRILEQFMTFIDEWYSLALGSRLDSTSRFSFSSMVVTLERSDNAYEIYISIPCGYILDFFYMGTTAGDNLQEAISRNFLLVCSRVFCYQMINWVVLGKLVDPFEEFVVGRFSIAAVMDSESSLEETPDNLQLLPNDSCFEALDIEEDWNNLLCEEEATHCGIFEWEGLFYVRFESFTKKFLPIKLLYKIFGVGKIVSLLGEQKVSEKSRLLNRFKGRENSNVKIEFATEDFLEEISTVLNEAFLQLQSHLEGFLEGLRKRTSSLMFESVKSGGLFPGLQNQLREDPFRRSVQLMRNLYLLGSGEVFLQLDNSLFENFLGRSLSRSYLSISEQFNFISSTWKDLLTSFRIGSYCDNRVSSLELPECRISICCDTFDLFNFNIHETELIDSLNCQVSGSNTLILAGGPEPITKGVLGSTQANKKESDEGDGGQSMEFDHAHDMTKIAAICRIKWPIRIIDGFNHVLECVSTVNTTSSLLFSACGNLPLGDSLLGDFQDDNPQHQREFLRFTWSFQYKDKMKQKIEFNVRLYWHTEHLKSLLGTEKSCSLLKSSHIEVPNPFVSPKDSDLYSYRLRILFKQSNIALYMEPLRSIQTTGVNSLFARPTQALNIQHINIDICLPLLTSSCYIHLLRHLTGETLQKKELRVTKWCHISAAGSSDVISQLCLSSCANDSGSGSGLSSGSNASYNFNLLKGVSLNPFISGINFEGHVFRLRIVQNFPWPLALLFTKRNMELYYNLFDFYWLFFRTFNGLERVWREAFNLRYCNRRMPFSPFYMGHGVAHHWNYMFYCRWVLQVTIGEIYSFFQRFVVEQVFESFLGKVEDEEDFESIIQRHGDLVHSLTLKSGLLLPSVLSPLTSILVLTSEWSLSLFEEISRWNKVCEATENGDYFSSRATEGGGFPWRAPEWEATIHKTVRFMNNFVLLWDSFCSEISIVSNNIQYQHFSFLLSTFNNNRWSIDIPELDREPGEDRNRSVGRKTEILDGDSPKNFRGLSPVWEDKYPRIHNKGRVSFLPRDSFNEADLSRGMEESSGSEGDFSNELFNSQDELENELEEEDSSEDYYHCGHSRDHFLYPSKGRSLDFRSDEENLNKSNSNVTFATPLPVENPNLVDSLTLKFSGASLRDFGKY